MALPDRILPLCDLLLGAAHADKRFVAREREAVRRTLADLTGAAMTSELEARILEFEPSEFELATTAAEFRGDPEEDRRRLLLLVAAIHDADDELDLAEDEYLRALAGALELPERALEGLTLDVQIEELREDLAKVRKLPPPPPGSKARA
ncbi:MAG TPA: TerB family tellurite resistance protein [Gemmatimonadaceae bacterium]|nr:TerB family tellurite resistance protein [Gemmatimonadaceae bacterium]